MKKYSLLLVIIFFIEELFMFSLNNKEQKNVPVKGYKLVWQDEFNGKKLDLLKWNYILGKRRDSYNVKETVYLDGNGFLHLNAKKKNDSVFTGMISTRKLFETKYGYFECRAKLTKVLGIWPAFWLLSDKTGADYGTPENNGAEIDIFEYFANNKRDTISHNLHWGGYGTTHKEIGFIYAPLIKTADNFHNFALEWTDSSYTTFVDGKKTASGNNLISKVEQFLILSVECDASVAGPLQPSTLPDDFIIDYIRVYKKK